MLTRRLSSLSLPRLQVLECRRVRLRSDMRYPHFAIGSILAALVMFQSAANAED